MRAPLVFGWLALAAAAPAVAQPAYFEMVVVDEGGAPVACVELRTVHELRFASDANGRVVFYEPGLMDTEVWFHVSGPHVEVEPDLFGYRGATLAVTEGGAATIEVRRTADPGCEPGDLASRRLARGVPDPTEYFRVDVVDDETGRGVPLVELALRDRTYVTDSAGVIAIDPLGLAGTSEAQMRSHGYSFDGDGRVELNVTPGGRATVTATRQMVAERLYRVTGGGIYRDSVLLGLDAPLARPVIDGLVVGQDTVFTTVHRGRLFWIWGDTNRPAYPLGHFRTAGATSALPADGGLDPERGVDLSYFVGPDGFSRPMAPAETVPGDGLIWMSGLVSVPDARGEERMFGVFTEQASLEERTRFGMLEWDDAAERFVEAVAFDDGPDERYPRENAFVVPHGDERWVYYHQSVRIPARAEALRDPSTYEAFTPYTDRDQSTIERDGDGVAVYRWRAGGIPAPAVGAGLGSDGLHGHLVDVDSGEGLEAHENGSTEYNPHTGRYLRLIMNRRDLGEIWMALADTPMGPWVAAQRVVHHDDYTFYNPRHHVVLDRDFGRRIYFEGTYTSAFSGADEKTPRYDYNQIMYALDMDRPALQVPVPIYVSERGELGPVDVVRPGDAPIAASFLAPVGPRPGTEPVWWSGPDCEPRRLIVGGEPETPPIFYVRLPDAAASHQSVLYESWGAAGESPRYSLDREGNAHALGVVWRSPLGARFPVGEHRRWPLPDAGPDRCLAEGEPIRLDGEGWLIDGAPAASAEVVLGRGLHVVTRVTAGPDGRSARDHALVRVGEAPRLTAPSKGGCGCRIPRPGSSVPAGLLPLLVLMVTCRVRLRSPCG